MLSTLSSLLLTCVICLYLQNNEIPNDELISSTYALQAEHPHQKSEDQIIFASAIPLELDYQSLMDTIPGIKIGLLETIELLNRSGKTYFEPYHHGTLEVGLYRPVESDPQQPHDKDEVYVILHGSGKFICGGNTVVFEPGDVLFVPANTEHRFIDFTKDFLTWAIFYGREGGEGD